MMILVCDSRGSAADRRRGDEVLVAHDFEDRVEAADSWRRCRLLLPLVPRWERLYLYAGTCSPPRGSRILADAATKVRGSLRGRGPTSDTHRRNVPEYGRLIIERPGAEPILLEDTGHAFRRLLRTLAYSWPPGTRIHAASSAQARPKRTSGRAVLAMAA